MFRERDDASNFGMEVSPTVGTDADAGMNTYLGGWSAFKMPAMNGDFIGSGRSHSRHWNVRGGSPLG